MAKAAANRAAFVISISTAANRDDTPEDTLARHFRQKVWWSTYGRDVDFWADKPGYVRFISTESQIIGRARFTGRAPTKTARKDRPWSHEVEFDSPEPVLGIYVRDFVSPTRSAFFGLTAAEHRRLDKALAARGAA